VAAEERPEREMVPDLIDHFKKFIGDHHEYYLKIQKNFQEYFACVKEVIDYLS
jgi:hypothetical protein